MGTDKGTIERGWEVSSAYIGFLQSTPGRWEDTLDKRGIERPDET